MTGDDGTTHTHGEPQTSRRDRRPEAFDVHSHRLFTAECGDLLVAHSIVTGLNRRRRHQRWSAPAGDETVLARELGELIAGSHWPEDKQWAAVAHFEERAALHARNRAILHNLDLLMPGSIARLAASGYVADPFAVPEDAQIRARIGGHGERIARGYFSESGQIELETELRLFGRPGHGMLMSLDADRRGHSEHLLVRPDGHLAA